MISAQNLRRLLSGNKWPLIALLIIGTCSCGATNRKTQYTPIETPTGKKTETAPSAPKKEETAMKGVEKEKESGKETISTSKLRMRYKDFDVPDNVKKDVYNIAILLPFKLDNIPNTVTDPRTVVFTTQTKIAIDFYQGVEAAIAVLKAQNVNLNIHVLDVENDTATSKLILSKYPFPNIDLIIGPVYNSNLRIFAKYALDNKIPIISPLSSSSTITSNNPYFFSANATARTHFYSILNRILQDEPSAKIWVLKGSGDETDEDVIQTVFNEDFAPLYPSAKISTIQFAGGDSSIYSKNFRDNRTNHLIIPSYNENFIQRATGLLGTIDSLVPVRVYGTPKWADYDINYSINPFVSVYITNSYFNSPYNSLGQKFRADYKEYNRRNASEYTLQGYDLMWYVGNLLSKGGFFSAIQQGKSFSGFLQTDFSFAPVYVKNKMLDIDYFDNKFVHWLVYGNGKFNKVAE